MAVVKIEICVGSACYLLGSQDLIEMIEDLPANIKANIDLRGSSCLKASGRGPNIRVNDELISGVTPEKLMEIIRDKCQTK